MYGASRLSSFGSTRNFWMTAGRAVTRSSPATSRPPSAMTGGRSVFFQAPYRSAAAAATESPPMAQYAGSRAATSV
jgi:hypothetical protein